jgi:N6-adenosine-specific RNA methylase IME4
MEGGAGGPMRGRGGRGRGGGGGGGGGFRGPASNPRLQRAKNDFCQHFVDTGERPANFIRDSDVQQRFDEYPRLKELIAAKDKRIADRAAPSTYKRVDLRTFDLTMLGTKFDVVLIDPPWEEYRRRKSVATGELDDCEDVEVWSPQEIMNLRIDAITDTPSFCFLWCGAGVGLTWGRAMLRKWGFRRCEDICWIKSNRESKKNHDYIPDSVVTPTAEHCLVGIKGTVRRNYDGHIIHANVDTDVMVGEEPPYGATTKPTELYSIIEHFAQGRRRLELFGEDHNLRRGWLTLGKELSGSNHEAAAWARHFDGTVESFNAEGEPPTLLPNHLNGTTPQIEGIRPKSPTQLREEYTKRVEREAKAREERGEPPLPMPEMPRFVEQHPFNMG